MSDGSTGEEDVRGAVEALNERLDRLAADMAASSRGGGALPVELANLPGQLDALGASTSEIRVRLAPLGELAGRVDRLEELLTAVAQQLAEDASRRAVPESEPDGTEEALLHSLEELRHRVEELVETEARGREAWQRDQQAAIEAMRPSVAGPIGVLGDRLDALEAAVNQSAASMSGPVSDLLRQVLDTVETRTGASADEVATRLAALESRLGGELDAQRRALDSQLGVFGDAIAGRVAAMAAAGSASALDSFTEHVNGLEQHIQAGLNDVIDDLAAMVEAIGQSEGRSRDALATVAATLPQAIGDHLDSRVGPMLDALEARIASARMDPDGSRDLFEDLLRSAVEPLRADLEGLRSATDRTTAAAEGAAATAEQRWTEAGALSAEAAAMARETRDAARETASAVAQTGSAIDAVAAAVDRVSADLATATGAVSGDLTATLERVAADLQVAVDEVRQTRATTGEAAAQTTSAAEALAGVVRTELLGIRQGLRAALDQAVGEVNDAGAARLQSFLGSLAGELDERLETATQAAASAERAVGSNAEAVRAALASTSDTLHAAVRDLDRANAERLASITAAIESRPGMSADVLQAIEAQRAAAERSLAEIRADLRVVVGRLDNGGEPIQGAVAHLESAIGEAVTALQAGLQAGLQAAVQDVMEQGIRRSAEAANPALDALSAQVGALPERLSQAVADLPSRTGAELAPLAGQVAAAVAAQIADLPTAVSNALAAMPRAVASQVSGEVSSVGDRVVAGLQAALESLPDRVGARVDSAVGPSLDERVAAVVSRAVEAAAVPTAPGTAPTMEAIAEVLESVAVSAGRAAAAAAGEQVRGLSAQAAADAARAAGQAASSAAATAAATAVSAAAAGLADTLNAAAAGAADAVHTAAAGAADSVHAASAHAIESFTAAASQATDSLNAAAANTVQVAATGAADSVTAAAAEQIADVVRQAITDSFARMQTPRAGDAETLAQIIRDAATAASESLTLEAVESASRTVGGSVSDQVTQAVEAAVQESVERAVEHAVAAALARQPEPEPERTPTPEREPDPDREPTAETIQAAVSDAIDRLVREPVSRLEAAVIEATSAIASSTSPSAIATPALPPTEPATNLTPAMVAAVAATLDDFGERVDADLAAMGERLAAVSTILEQVASALQEVMARRRGAGAAGTEAFEIIRRVAAEANAGVEQDHGRRRTPKRTLEP